MMNMMKTKIIITFGPSVSEPSVLKRAVRHADIVRINFSHGDSAYWINAVAKVKKAAEELGKEVALLADLPGPKVRVGVLNAPVVVRRGATVVFGQKKGGGDITVEYPLFYRDAKKGATVDIGDGDARFIIKEIRGRSVVCKAVEDGVVKSRKGISLLGLSMSATAPTKTDMRLAKFAHDRGFDFVGMSFVRSDRDIRTLKRANKGMRVIAKIEKREAVENIEGIAVEADGIMVARGDLAMDVRLEHIPEVQRKIINAARKARKPVIVATQLLASMVNNPTPTRAEVNDIANAVMDGVDCLMLSDETTVGKYPVDAVEFLVNTAKVAERIAVGRYNHRDYPKITAVNMGIAFAAADLADEYKTDCIFVPTQTGATAKMLSELRPDTLVIALATSPSVRRSLSIYYGLMTWPIPHYRTMDEMVKNVNSIAKMHGIRSYIMVSGSPNKPGSTDTLKYVGNVHS